MIDVIAKLVCSKNRDSQIMRVSVFSDLFTVFFDTYRGLQLEKRLGTGGKVGTFVRVTQISQGTRKVQHFQVFNLKEWLYIAISYTFKFLYACGSGPRGHGFESRHSDQKRRLPFGNLLFLFAAIGFHGLLSVPNQL